MTPQQQTPLHRSPRAWLWALVLVWAVLLVGGWGHVHRVLHPGLPSLGVSEASAQKGFAGLADEDGSSLCQLLDHLSQASGLPLTLALALPLALPSLPVRLFVRAVPSLSPQAFQARAPPASI